MKTDDLLDVIGDIDDALVEEAGKMKKKKSTRILIWGAAAACLCIAAAVTFFNSPLIKDKGRDPAYETTNAQENAGNTAKAGNMKYVAASPDIPEQIMFTEDYDSKQYDEYYEQNRSRLRENATDFNFGHFFGVTAETVLAEKDGKNKIYSPANLFAALSMLASCTDGETREQVLGVLGAASETEAAETAVKLIKGNYIDNGSRKSLFANSVWTGEKYLLKEDFLHSFSDRYYAPVFKGDALDSDYSIAFTKWLSDATGGFLSKSAKDMGFDPEMALTLASTLYFAANWDTEFLPENNTDGLFRGVASEQNCEFMNQTLSGAYITGDCFGAVAKNIGGGGDMYFILPEEGVSPEDVIASEDLKDLFFNTRFYKNPDNGKLSYPVIHFSVPKFDVSSDLELKDSLSALGVSDVFDSGKADFSHISDDNLFLSRVRHSARVAIDEQGVTAAAFTVEAVCGAGMPLDEIYFTLDRPFIFAITGDTGDLLFIGIVNQL